MTGPGGTKNEHFKTGLEIHVKEDEAGKEDPRVVKMESEGPREPSVREFGAPRLRKPGEGDYAQVKAKYGPLATTDSDRAARTQKDSRFHLNALVKEPLSVKEEEQRVIEQMLQARVQAVDAEVRERARKEGYEAGSKQGHADAFEAFRKECEPRMENLDRLLAELEAAKQEIFKANERLLMEMVYRIAKLLFLKEVSADREYVLRLASELIERVGLKDGIRISISPAEKLTIEEVKQALLAKMSDLTNLTVEVSDQVAGGGCLLETPLNAIDASVETQLDGMYASVFGIDPDTAGTPKPEAAT